MPPGISHHPESGLPTWSNYRSNRPPVRWSGARPPGGAAPVCRECPRTELGPANCPYHVQGWWFAAPNKWRRRRPAQQQSTRANARSGPWPNACCSPWPGESPTADCRNAHVQNVARHHVARRHENAKPRSPSERARPRTPPTATVPARLLVTPDATH